MNEQPTSLKQQTKKGLYWSALGNFANQGMRFAFGIILARLLSPDAYGVIGMLSIFMCLVSVFIDCGFSQALVVKSDRTQKDFSTEFWFNIGVGLVGYLLLFVSSPYIADFYNMPILSPVLKVIGIGIVVNSLCVVQSAQFTIRLDFKTPVKIGVITQILTGIIGIILAYFGWGVWALVFQQVLGSVLSAILLWIAAGWRPTCEFSTTSFRYLWSYGSRFLGTSLVSMLFDNIQPLIIGKIFSAQTLGLYSRAQGFATLPSSNLSGVLGRVTFPILAKVNGDIDKLSSIYRRMMKVVGFIVFPLMVGLSATSRPVVELLLNSQWYGCIILLKILCFALMFQPISYVNISLLEAAKRPDIMFKLELIKKPLGLLILLLSSYFGIVSFSLGYLFVCVFSVLMNIYYTSKILQISFWCQIKDLLPSLLLSFVMGGITYIITLFIQNNLLSLVVSVLLGAGFYILFSYMFLREIMLEALSLLKKK